MRKSMAAIIFAAISLASSPSQAATTPPLVGYAAKAGGTALNVLIPKELLTIPLTDADGKTFTLGGLKGKTVVLTDFLTLCNEICPMISVNMREIGDAIVKSKLKGKVAAVELTVDPKRDTPTRLKKYQALFNDPSWTMATGTAAGLSNLWSWFGVYYQTVKSDTGVIDWMTGKPITYDVNHADVIVIIGPDLHWRWLDLGTPAVTNPKSKNVVPSKLFSYLSATGKSNLVKPEEPSWSTSAVYGALNEILKINLGK